MRFGPPLLVLLGLTAWPVEAKPCIPIKQVPKVLTPKGATIAAGGGIIVAYRNADAADEKSWRVRAGKQVIAPGIKPIAPGLDVYDVGPATGNLVLEDADQTELLVVKKGKVAALAAPKLKRIWSNSRATGYRSSYGYVVAELDGKAPENAIALVVYNKDGEPKSWGAVNPSATAVTVYSTGACGSGSGGATASHANDSVKLAWVDSAGRISKLSGTLTIALR